MSRNIKRTETIPPLKSAILSVLATLHGKDTARGFVLDSQARVAAEREAGR